MCVAAADGLGRHEVGLANAVGAMYVQEQGQTYHSSIFTKFEKRWDQVLVFRIVTVEAA